MLRLLLIGSERSGALACVPRESRLCVGRRSWHIATRSCAEGEKRIAVRWSCMGYEPTTTSAARSARVASMRAAPPPMRQLARSRARHAKASCALKAAAGTSHQDLAPKDRSLSSVQWPWIGCGQTITSAARHARVASTRAAPTRERDSDCSGVPARLPRESRLCVGGRSWYVAPRSCTEGERPFAGAAPF